MDADESRAIELITQGHQQIATAIIILAERYGPGIIAQCQIYVDGATAQAMAEQVIAEAVKKLGNYQGNDLSVPLYKAATAIAKAKRASMLRDLWKADRQGLAGNTLKEREDTALLRFRKLTDLSWKQIAEIMGMTEGQARVRGHRALRDRLESKNERKSS